VSDTAFTPLPPLKGDVETDWPDPAQMPEAPAELEARPWFGYPADRIGRLMVDPTTWMPPGPKPAVRRALPPALQRPHVPRPVRRP
jgi:hypothetical protein